jgi:hypothetical protein
VNSVLWERRGALPSRDATGALDFGNIDALRFESDQYYLEGDWGSMHITSSQAPRVELLDRVAE